MLVLPYKRNPHTVLVLERIFADGSTIAALNAVLSGPATKICCHFDFSPLL
jgi:hypothetical protein